jgi:putative transposase
LRTRFVNNDAVSTWALNVPCDIREDGMRDFRKAWSSAADTANFKFRSRKRNATDTFAVRRRIMSVASDRESVTLYARFFKKFHVDNAQIATSESLPDMRCDCKVQWDRRAGAWFLCVPVPLAVQRGDTQAPLQCRTVALDPGVRAFQTLYDPQRCEMQQWSDGDIKRIVRLCTHLDKTASAMRKARAGLKTVPRKERLQAVKTLANVRLAAGRLRTRVRDLVDDMHRHLARYLAENYELILLPAFHTSQMVPRKGRKTRSKTARSMLMWAHYRFQQFLLHKARE